MKLFDRFKNRTTTKFKMVSDNGGGFYEYDGKLYKSDIVRACIRPKVRAIGKAVAKHVRKDAQGLTINPEPYMRFLLEEPNQYMTGQVMQEKLATQLELNGNAFALIERDENGLPVALYPVNCSCVQLIVESSGSVFLKFYIKNGRPFTSPYEDVIHLRKDFYDDEFFGESPAKALTPLMEIVSVSDQGIVKAIKNSSIIRWLLKFNTTLRKEDLESNAKNFSEGFMSKDSKTGGVAAIDAKADAQQVQNNDYVPNAAQMDRTTKRILSFFNTNEKIVQSAYTENEWISYYESCIEPDIAQMSGEYTRKLFTRRERGYGNKIVFESMNLMFASMQTKLNLVQYLDRRTMSPNEVREALGLAPIPGGDEMLQRKDTGTVTKGGEGNAEDQGDNHTE